MQAEGFSTGCSANFEEAAPVARSGRRCSPMTRNSAQDNRLTVGANDHGPRGPLRAFSKPHPDGPDLRVQARAIVSGWPSGRNGAGKTTTLRNSRRGRSNPAGLVASAGEWLPATCDPKVGDLDVLACDWCCPPAIGTSRLNDLEKQQALMPYICRRDYLTSAPSAVTVS